MSYRSADSDEIKRKLRNLKKLEIRIRTGNEDGKPLKMDLVWNEFFDISGTGSTKGRYKLENIVNMNKEEFKSIVNEFFFSVYYKFYRENGIVNYEIYDPEIIKWMGLLPDAGIEDIKRRFRELAKKYHPDMGGNSNEFIELIENYKKLIE